jgi:hypothetical protein
MENKDKYDIFENDLQYLKPLSNCDELPFGAVSINNVIDMTKREKRPLEWIKFPNPDDPCFIEYNNGCSESYIPVYISYAGIDLEIETGFKIYYCVYRNKRDDCVFFIQKVYSKNSDGSYKDSVFGGREVASHIEQYKSSKYIVVTVCKVEDCENLYSVVKEQVDSYYMKQTVVDPLGLPPSTSIVKDAKTVKCANDFTTIDLAITFRGEQITIKCEKDEYGKLTVIESSINQIERKC